MQMKSDCFADALHHGVLSDNMADGTAPAFHGERPRLN